MKRRLMLIAALLCAASVSTAEATLISTGGPPVYGISTFGESNTATYGQTFTLNAGDDTSLDSVSFYINDYSNPDNIDFAFYLYEWNGTRITGGSLYTSGMMSTTGQSGFEPFTVNTGGVDLVAGTDYAFFVSASNFFDGLTGTGYMGASNSYANGHFVFLNNGSNFNMLSTNAWNHIYGYDLAFNMQLSPASQVPEPTALLLLGSGLAGAGLMRKFKNRRS